MVKLKKMILISMVVNAILFFGMFGVGIVPGLNLVGVPFLIFGIMLTNAVLFFYCAFSCEMPTMPSSTYSTYSTSR